MIDLHVLLRKALAVAARKQLDVRRLSVRLNAALDRIGEDEMFTIIHDVFITSRFEEAEFSIHWSNGPIQTIAVCAIPYVPTRPTEFVRR